MPTLADIYSAINSAQRRGGDFIRNPGTSLQQMLGNANDRARALNEQDRAATDEFLATGQLNGPKQMQSAMDMAGAYNPVGMTKIYRGLSQPYNPNQVNAIDWFTPDQELARSYGKHIVEKELPKDINPFDFALRTYSTELKLGNMVDRVKDGILNAFKEGKITESKAKSLFKKASSITSGNEYKPAANWISDDERLANLLKESGYNAISHVQDGIQTYGFLNK